MKTKDNEQRSWKRRGQNCSCCYVFFVTTFIFLGEISLAFNSEPILHSDSFDVKSIAFPISKRAIESEVGVLLG